MAPKLPPVSGDPISGYDVTQAVYGKITYAHDNENVGTYNQTKYDLGIYDNTSPEYDAAIYGLVKYV
jgi:hypothetical protein